MRFPETLTAAQVEVVEDLRKRDGKERAAGIRNDSSLKAIAPAVAELLYFLVVSRQAQVMVEFGTSHGYSTIHLAAAAERTDGHVHSVDIMPEKAAQARANLEKAELLHRVTLAVADGVEFAAQLPDAVDLVLVDYGVEAFAPAFDDLRRRMAPGCLVFVDGGPAGYWDAGPARQFRCRLEEDPSFLVVGLPMHREELLAVYLPDLVDASA
jgi:predicted O-methyltransferase YrrM